MSTLGAGSSLGFQLGVAGVTTTAQVRDRIHDLLEQLNLPWKGGPKMRRYRNEGDGNFRNWCEMNPTACLRRFQVRQEGPEEQPEVSGMDFDMRHVTLTVLVAYPQTGRFGADMALDRDDIMDQDWGEIQKIVGIYGRANFFGNHDCTPLGVSDPEAEVGRAADFLVMRARFSFYRAVGATL